MSHSFDIVTESPASVDQIRAAFGREDYWAARIAAAAADTTLDSLIVDADRSVTVRTTQRLGRQVLPEMIAKHAPGEMKLVKCEIWRPIADGQARGQVSVSVSDGLGSGSVEAWLTPAGNGSQLRYAATVKVRMPLLGGQFEKSIGARLATDIPKVQRFTDEWIAEHDCP